MYLYIRTGGKYFHLNYYNTVWRNKCHQELFVSAAYDMIPPKRFDICAP